METEGKYKIEAAGPGIRLAHLICLFLITVWLSPETAVRAAEEKEEKKLMTLPLSENLVISAENVAPELDEKSGDLIGLAASGKVSIKVRPKGSDRWVYVSCGKLVYDVDQDLILLKQNPVVKSGIQLLRATSDETYVSVSRKSGKWMIKGPHKIELKLK